MPDTPPRRRQRTTRVKPPEIDDSDTTPAPEPAPVRAPGKGPANLQRKLEMMIAGMGLPFAAAGDQHCAMVFAQRAPVVAEAWANLANESPAVKRVLENMLKGGAWTGAIGATAGLLIPVATHHGLTPPSIPVFGQKREPEQEQEQEQYMEPVPPMNGNNGYSAPTAPGPAAVSVKSPNDGPDLTNPAAYPGNTIPDN